DRVIPGPDGDLPVRIYTPENGPDSASGYHPPFPVLVMFHGGGFIAGSPESHDGGARELCVQAQAIVVSVDYRLAPEHKFPAAVANAEGYLLTTASMRWMWSLYVNGPGDYAIPYAAPIAAASLAGLPPALVITAEFDPLRDEGEAYGRAMAAAGVPVTISRYN